MIAPHYLRKISALASVMLGATFMVLLWLPALDNLLWLDHTHQVDEKRALAPFPPLPDFARLRSFITGVEAYYNDHFGFRRRLIYWAQTWKRQCLGVSRQAKVVVGRKGWLYYTGEAGGLARNSRVREPFSPSQLQQWKALLECRQAWLARRGIHYLFVIAPDKQTIYPEYLPEWINHPSSVTKLDQWLGYMKTHATVEILDLRPVLLQAKQSRQIYFCTDSHWNQYGAFIACEELVRTLARPMSWLNPLSLDALQIRLSDQPGGDLAWLLAGAESIPEKNCPSLAPLPPLQPLQVSVVQTNWGRIQIVENSTQRGKAMIFGDSFGEGWFPFLGYHFRLVKHYRLYEQGAGVYAHIWIPPLIERDKPEVVVDEMVESFLSLEDPAEIRRQDNLER